MSKLPNAQHAQSLNVPNGRPVMSRQRSNSLPPGLAMMNAEEAGMLFSAAEKATARRRRAQSIHHPALPESPPDSRENSPTPTPAASATPLKPSSLRKITFIRASLDKPLPPKPCTPAVGTHDEETRLAPSHIQLPEVVLENIPVLPLSPKRQVASQSLKSYADGLFQFTHSVLTTTIPTLQVESPQPTLTAVEPIEQDSVVTPPTRPSLSSKFSDWSIATGACTESRRDSLAMTPIDLNPKLLSPDSFFGVNTTPRRNEFDFNFSRCSGITFASSETYEPLSSQQPPTPPSPTSHQVDKEISYFTNFDQFIDSCNWPLRNGTPPLNVMIDLSPLELATRTPAPVQKRTCTSLRIPARSAPLLSTNAPPFLDSNPPSAYQVADVAIMMPHPVIRAIG